jgi:2-(1,2-epoxy-1,2-dihydrophenyl)acetyl-CoA isomerase
LIAERSPITTRLTKRTVGRATTFVDVEQHVRFELQNISRAFRSNDAQEARQAFFEKRAPNFEGK